MKSLLRSVARVFPFVMLAALLWLAYNTGGFAWVSRLLS